MRPLATGHRSAPLAALAVALVCGCTGLIGSGGDGSADDAVAKELCVVDTPIRRMTRFEYNNTVRDLLGDDTNPADVLPPEEEVAGFNNQAGALTTSDLLVEQYANVAETVSARAITNMTTLMDGCDPASQGSDACALSFIERWGQRAYRRPLEQDEIDRLKGVFDWAVADPDLGTFEDGIQIVIEVVLQSPSFLYRPEYGSELPVEGDVVPFTSWEMATKLSYMLWNTMPDDQLFEAAANDALLTREQIGAQAARMLENDRAKDTIRNFHRQWLLLTELDNVTKDTSIYPAFNASLRPLWEEEIQTFIEQVILEGDGSLQTLLTGDYSFMNEELASFYGDDVVEPVTGTEFQRVQLDPTRRAGFLTSAALMATHANLNQSSPVFRGKFVREQLMCNTLPLPPNDLVIEPPELDPNKTTKEQFEEIGADPACASCHSLMNPIGFIFEHYDGVGQWRDQQNGKDVDAVGEVVQTDDIDGTYDGAIELAQALAASTQVQECVSSQWFRFAYNRSVTQLDSCSIEQINERFAASNFNVRELLVALTQTNAFLYRRAVVAEQGGAQ
ncbi:MAG: DUF1592 domain-containing protein [Myxococcales bacterium]|nr:DUF1592 domain-containing protein [Myxococcales bacterium]MDH3483701.1 DUF1592 domain-containing protein [Myxococcales bacterium]